MNSESHSSDAVYGVKKIGQQLVTNGFNSMSHALPITKLLGKCRADHVGYDGFAFAQSASATPQAPKLELISTPIGGNTDELAGNLKLPVKRGQPQPTNGQLGKMLGEHPTYSPERKRATRTPTKICHDSIKSAARATPKKMNDLPKMPATRKRPPQKNARQRAKEAKSHSYAAYLFSSAVPEQLVKRWEPILSKALQDDPYLLELTNRGRKASFIEQLPHYTNADEVLAAINVVKRVPWQMLEVLRHARECLQVRSIRDQSWSEIAKSTMITHVSSALSTSSVSRAWYTLDDDQQLELAYTAVASMMPLTEILDRLVNACGKAFEQVKVPDMVACCALYEQADRITFIQMVTKLKGLCWPTILASHLTEYWQPQCFYIYNKNSNLSVEAQTIFEKGRGMATSPLELMTVLGWLKIGWIRSMLYNVAKTSTCIEFNIMKEAIDQLHRDLATLDVTHCSKKKEELKDVKTIDGLLQHIKCFTSNESPMKQQDSFELVRGQIATQQNEGITLAAAEIEMSSGAAKDAFTTVSNHTGYALYQWQQLAVGLLLASYQRYNGPTIINVPTGMGKSLVCYALAIALIKSTNKKVMLVTQTKFGKHTSVSKYALSQYSDSYPAAEHSGRRIWHCTFEELVQITPKIDANDFILVIDEVDTLVAHLVSFTLTRDGKKTVISNAHGLLSRYEKMIGVSGSISKPILQKLFVGSPMPCQAFFSISPRMLSEANKVNKKIVVDAEATRLSATISHVKSVMMTKKIVIVIDDQLHENIGKWREEFPDAHFLYGWNDPSQFPAYENQLEHFKTLDCVLIVTDADGARGTDFKFADDPHVVISLRYLSYALLLQCLGRGSRRADQISYGSIVLSKKQDVPNVLRLDQYLLDCQAANISNFVLKNRIAYNLDQKMMVLTREQKATIGRILNSDEPLYYDDFTQTGEAKENYEELSKLLKPKLRLPEVPHLLLYD